MLKQISGQNQFHLQKLKSTILQVELTMLTLNKWEFIVDHPFSPLIHWLKKIRKIIPEEKFEDFRQFRSISIKNLCCLIISCNKQYPLPIIIAAASLTDSFSRYPGVFADLTPDNWMNQLTKEIPEEFVKVQIRDIACKIPDIMIS